MTRTYLSVLLLCLTAAPAVLSAADAKAEVLAVMQEWKVAALKGDNTTLDRLLHPDITYSHSNGRTESKKDILSSKPTMKEVTFGSDMTVRVYGNTALVKGNMDVVNETTTLKLSVLHVWLKGPKGWQLVGRQSTRLNP
ncbi:MAG: nuclear transport factor 2 family protein [Bryobacteraceae bacterium]|nr:nuclear transport factor 2 family protein [Bryobacteraceae bacterium]